jgi:hypothetical protein
LLTGLGEEAEAMFDRRVFATWLMVSLGASTGVSAQPHQPSAEVKAHHDQGVKLYNLSDWSDAMEEFRAAYLIRPDPVFLFNIAQCERQLGRFEGAAQTYRAFLRESQELSADQASKVRALITQMEDAQRERPRKPPTGPAPGGLPLAPVAERSPSTGRPLPPPAKPPLYKRWWLWAPVGVAAAAIAIGLAVGLTSRSASYPNPGGSNSSFSF